MKKTLIIVIVVIALGIGSFFLLFNKPKDEEQTAVTYTYAIEDPFITNVKESEKLFKTSIILVVNKDKMDEYLEKNIYVIRDTILIILRNLTVKDISGMDIQEGLRRVIPAALNKALDIDNIVSVYFGDFVMQ